MQIKYRLKIIGMAALLGTAIAAYADPAPVYDADELEPGTYVEQDNLPPTAGPVEEHEAAPVRQRAARVNKVESQPAASTNNVIDSDSGAAAQIESLQTQVQALRDQVEQLTHQLKQIEAEQKATYTDIDGRLSKLTASEDHRAIQASILPKPAKNENVTKQEEKVADSQPDVAEEQQIYQTAYTQIKDKKYDDAVITLQTMLKKYPRGQFASNAHYWLGELYGLLGKNDKSLNEFVTVVTNYPKSPRVSDAQLKVGLIFASQSKWTEAKSAFKKVINHYPGTASSRLASEQLKQIDKAGH